MRYSVSPLWLLLVVVFTQVPSAYAHHVVHPVAFMPESVVAATDKAAPVYRGAFKKVDYAVKGGFEIYRQGRGYKLAVKNLRIGSGPDLVLMLTDQVLASGNEDYRQISVLPKTRGSFEVAIPRGLEPGDFKYLQIHCRRFSHTFASAKIVRVSDDNSAS